MTAVSSDMRGVLLTGGLASGKTTVAIELGEALEAARAPFAVIDLDWLCWAWTPALADDGVHALLCDNLRAVLPNLRERGVRHLVLARAVLTPNGLTELREAVAPVPLTVIRLVTDEEHAQARLTGRDSGSLLEAHLARRASFERMVESAAPDATVVDTTGRDAVAVAAEVLTLVGWPPATQ